MKSLDQSEEDFEAYQGARLERCKRIGVPNLALEMAERNVQVHFYKEREPETLTVNDLADLLDTIAALGEARFSTAHENQRGLFETADEWLERVRKYILDRWETQK